MHSVKTNKALLLEKVTKKERWYKMIGKTISFVKGKGSLRHNNRHFFADNVDVERISLNRIYKQESLEEAYEYCFGDALREYNEKQTRSDRKKGNYINEIKNSGNNEKVFYENVVQIGTMYDTGVLDADGNVTVDAQKAAEVLEEYARTFQERNPNLYLFNAVLHMDEATPHLHLDWIPVAHGYKKGMKTRNSLTKAFQEMGFDKAMDKKHTETMEWQKRERDYIRQLCREKEIFVVRKGEVRDNYSISEYKEAMRAKESVERETVEMKEHLEALTKRMKAYSLEADTLPVVKKAIDKEVNEINSSVKITRPLFGNEDVVQVPKSVWDKILKVFSWVTFKQKTYDKVIAKNNTQEKEIQGLSGKLQEIKNYIRNRGLEKDYDNYLHRDDMEYRLARKRQEMKEMEQARLQKKTRSNREDR
jgi:hypothetical protein